MKTRSASTDSALLEVIDLVKHFVGRRGLSVRVRATVRAVDGVSFSVQRGQTLALVGESGCGKSTVARSITRLIEPTGGIVRLDGVDVSALGRAALRRVRRDMQIIFQDPYASLNPRWTVRQTLTEKYRNFGVTVKPTEIDDLLVSVGLRPEHARRYPHEFSGGQRQRIGIARAIALNPQLVILDEPVSALDVSIQAQVVNLLKDLQESHGLTYLFIAHDLAVVRQMADRVAVMYLGRIVEYADRDTLFANPRHPYTAALLSAIPIPDPHLERARKVIVVTGELPSPANPPMGCRFHTRCWKRPQLPTSDQKRCTTEEPALGPTGDRGSVACHFPLDSNPTGSRPNHTADPASRTSAEPSKPAG